MAAKDKENAGGKPKRSKLKIILIILLLIFLMIGGAIAFWWFQMRQPGDGLLPGTPNMPTASSPQTGSSATGSSPQAGQSPQSSQTAQNQPVTDMPRPATSMASLPSVMVNLADAAGDRYLRVGMEVEVSTPDAVRELDAQAPKVRDAIIILLSGKTYTELSSAEGKMALKNEVAARLNQILGTPRVIRIYFTEFVVQ